ncbi:uncharacterized protein [Eleutherodactylus coqui]|uniref:uncharacterized protein n=1 Tax=Eleutherodactylus coqui TaxID=57060 RepID=UPI0034634B0F
MDERHWWIAGKVQQALGCGSEESPATLEAFILEAANLQLLNRFLQAGGHQAIFVIVEASDKTNPLTWKFSVKCDLQNLDNVNLKASFTTLLYFLRLEINHDVDGALMEKEILCGEIKENPVESFRCLLNELYIPLLRAQKDWGLCSQENVASFLSGLEKYVSCIDEATTINDLEKHHITILKRPQNIVSPDFLLQRSAVLDPEIVSLNETLVSDWIKAIDQVLMEAIDERVLDITTTPLTELERWRHRQKLLGLITEQLRGKECKSVISIMISSKSRLLKKWKAVDISITEAMNATKDRVKYLEALYRYFNALSTDNDPENLTNSILPAFFNSIQQMEMLSRHFSKNGFLGLLLTKVSNQLALNCKYFLKEIISTNDSKDRLWEILKEHIMKDKQETVSVSGFEEKKMLKKEELQVDMLKSDSTFYERIQACLAVYTRFQEEVQHLREWLLGTQGLQRYSSLSSVSTAPGRLSYLQTSKNNKTNMRVTQSVPSSSDQQHDYPRSAVAITDDDTIMYHLEALSIKLKHVLDIADKLQEYKILSKLSEGLRKPAPDDLMEDEDVESGSVYDSAMQEDPKESVDAQAELFCYQPQILRQVTSIPGKLQTLIEEDEPQKFVADSSMLYVASAKCEDSFTKVVFNVKNDEFSPSKKEYRVNGLSNEEKHMLANLYNREDVDEDECTLSSVLLEKVEQMIELLAQYIDADILLDTENRDHDPFEEGYSEFLIMNQQTEKYISVYKQALFQRRISCKDALSIIQRFAIVSHRPGIQHIISECYVEVYDWFYLELKNIQKEYETFKGEPALPKNMPPVVGAIVWSRKLMSRIENIMKAFKDVRIVSTSPTYSDTVKLYNRIASALVSYEDMWYQKWKSQIEKGLNGLNLTLLVREPVTQQLMVNTDMRMLQLIEETKWMSRLGIRVPETALLVLHQAEKLKMYRSNLEDIVKEYGKIQQAIPENFAVLFSVYLEQVNHQFQPGLSTLSWNSVNIEGFLHQTSAAVKRLQDIVSKVTEIKDLMIEKTLEEISSFDMIPMDEFTSGPKSPDEFLRFMQKYLMEKKPQIQDMAILIKNGFEYILKVLKKFQAHGKCVKYDKKKHFRPYVNEHMLKNMLFRSRIQTQKLRFKLSLKFQIPNILIEPSIDVAEDALYQVVLSIIDVSSCLCFWSGENKGQSFHMHMATDEELQHITLKILESIRELTPVVKKHVFTLSSYDFLWEDNMYKQSQEFLASNPSLAVMHKEVQHFLKIEDQIKEYSDVLQLGCISLDYSLIKETLKGFVESWKSHYATILHQRVKKELLHVLQSRERAWQQLTMPVESLEQLNSVLTLLEDLQNMENKIDAVYQPIEITYEQLRSYQLRIPREEVNDVADLRNKWAELIDLTGAVKDNLLKEKQDIFKQELDKQVKSFVVEVIQFRNRFDTQGPAAPGVKPEEAVTRLHDFNEKYQAYDAKRKTLNSVQKLFNIIPKKFFELDRTGKDLELLGTLYILFQKFIEFDQRFRNTLWADVDLKINNQEIEQYSSECQIWNDKLKDWDAYNEMARDIKFYEAVFPILHELKSKEIRNRHWLQVMSLTGSSFPLEANVFKVFHLLDIGLLKFQNQIISIAKAAKKEMELEIKMRKMEEEWSEQVLSFKPYKNKVLLVKDESLILLEELEDAQVLLAQMLTSKGIEPLKEEATTWAEKLKRVGDVLELWIDVQELWQHLEGVYNTPTIIQELPLDARRFGKVNRRWTLMMVSAYKTKNVLQFCCTGDVPKEVLLRHFHQELEICFCSLNSYLDRMRQTFPRFYFLSHLALISVLSRPYDIKYLQHHLRCLFSGVYSIEVKKVEEEESVISDEEEVEATGPVFDFLSVRSGNEGWLSTGQRSSTHITDTESIFQRALKSAGLSQERNRAILYEEPILKLNAVAVTGYAGECLQLDEQVAITSDLGVWLSNLHSSLRTSLNKKIYDVIADINQGMAIDEWTQKYPTQAAVLGLLYLWTSDFENSVPEIRQNRKAQYCILKKYATMAIKLSTIIAKGHWKHMEETISQSQKLKLENMIMQILYLRDVMENILSRKVRETADFDWKRTIRFYLKEKDGLPKNELSILDAHYSYGCEFYGAKTSIIMNPVTEKCFLKISQILQQSNGVILQGDYGNGKTETIKGLSYLLGNFLYIFTCSSVTDISALRRVIDGTALDGCWSCFDDFHLLPENAVSVFIHSTRSLYDSIQAKLPQITLQNGSQSEVQLGCSLFLTISKSGFQSLPKDILAMFRAVSLVFPDHTIILKAKLTSLGFKSPKALATRLQLTSELLKEQLPEEYYCHFSLQSLLDVIYWAVQRQNMEKLINGRTEIEGERFSRSSSVMSYQQFTAFATSPVSSLKTGNSADKNKKVTSTNPVPVAAKESHALIVDSLQDVIGPRMTGDNYLVFKQVVGDVFTGMYDPSNARQILHKEIERAIILKSEENKLFPHSPWLNKVKQLFNLSLIQSGVIVAGPPASGKSSCIGTLVQALNHIQVSSGEASHKIVKIHPLSVDSGTLMFGGQNASHMWEDGIVSYLWKKAIWNNCNTWLWFDGPLNGSWIDKFNCVLGPEKVLQLSNGDYLELPENLKLIFETTDLQTVSPATLTKAGILYIEGEALGWRPLSKIWLNGRNQQENTVLSKAFYRILDPIFNLILHDSKSVLPVTEVGLFNSFTSLLTTMLNEKAQSIGGHLHIERLFIFCLIWSVGSLIECSERKKFSALLKVYTSVLPDDDQEISVFDYFLDESGEWDTWQSRLPDITYVGNTDIMGETFIETQDTVIVRTFLEYASMGSRHILLTGPRGCGKTALMNDFISTQDQTRTLLKRMVFSGSSMAKELQELLQQNIVHRQGFIYGAKDGKTFQLFIDDLHLPTSDENGVQPCKELLRMLLDDKTLVKFNKPFEWQTVEGLLVKAVMGQPKYTNTAHRVSVQRLLRHFSIFHLPDLEGSQLQKVIFSVLEANMGDKDGLSLQEDLQLSLAKASCHLLESFKKVLVISSTPGRQHYLFSLREISKVFQFLRRLSNEDREDRSTVVGYWEHEMNCVIRDRLCRHTDITWFKSELTQTIKEYFPDITASAFQKIYTTFPLEPKFSHHASTDNKQVKVLLQSLEKLEDVQSLLGTIVHHYNEELGHQKLHIELSENVVIQVIRIHRVLCAENGGNALLVGCVGSHLSTLVKLALYVADIPLHALDISGNNNFFNSLKSAIQIAVVDGKPTAILCTAEELAIEDCLNAINSLLICGEYASLFTTEEMNDLLQVLGPAIRRKHPHLGYDPAKYFISQVKSNLRIIVCISPYHELLTIASRNYPGFLTGCQLIWIDSWSQDVINREAKHYIMQHRIMETHTEETREIIATAITLIHSYMLHDNDQVLWTGNGKPSIFSENAEEADQSNCDVGPAQFPYCKIITQEKLKLLFSEKTVMADKVYVGPSTLQMFLENFKCIFLKKMEEQHTTNNLLKHVLETLAKTRQDAKKTQEGIGGLEENYRAAKIIASDILDTLVTKTSMLEQLKAVLGIGDETLNIFLSQNENTFDNFDENDDLLKDDCCDEYDEAFYRMKEASKTSFLHDILQKTEKAADELEELQRNKISKKNEVMHWCSKVDKPCVERLVRCQNPPYLVAQILEMALVMMSCLPTSENINDLQKSSTSVNEKSGHRANNRLRPSPVNKSTPSKRGIKEPVEKVDRARWKKIQHHIGETSKFVEMIHQIAELEDGLPDETLKDVEAYLGKAKEGSHGVTGEGSLLENAAPYATVQSITPAKKYSHIDHSKSKGTKGGGITIATARYSLEDAASLVAFVVAIVEYTRLSAPLKECQKKLFNFEREKEDLILKEAQDKEVSTKNFEDEPSALYHQALRTLTADDLPLLQKEMTQLHEEYDTAVSHKHQLEDELQSQKEKLQAAVNMLDRLEVQEREWREKLNQSNVSDLLTNCVLAAAFITYCPALSVNGRRKVTDLLFKICESCGLPLPQKALLKNLPLIQFMQTPIEIKTLENRGLPTNPLALDNSYIFSNTMASNSWVLVSDPTGQAIDWIKAYLPEDVFEIMYNAQLTEMDTCLTVGHSLLLTYCEIQNLSRDVRLSQILRSKREFLQHNVPFKMMVGEHEVECHPSFRLYLHTTEMPEEIPPEIASFCTILYFCQDRAGLEEQLLDRFVVLEKPRLKNEQLQVKQECLNSMITLSALEEKIIATLQSHDSLLHSLSVTKKLGDLILQHEEATEMYMKSIASEDSLLLASGGFRQIAVRGAVMFDTVRILQQLNRMYDTSYKQLLQLFDVSVAHSERYSLKGIVACMTSNIFSYTSRSLLEKDRMVYALLVAFEVEGSLGRIKPGEREFIFSPELCVTVLQGMNSKTSESYQQAKSPFDWMSEQQFKNVQILAMYFDWFGELFDRMYKDSKDLTWKTFCESKQPENPSKVKWPEGMEALNPLQKFMILRAVRMDRILPSASSYISAVLGKMYALDVLTDIQATLSWMTPHEPGLLIYGADCNLPRILIEDFAETKNQKITVLPITFPEYKAKDVLIQAMSEGSWVLIENIHNSDKLMMSLGEILKSKKNPDKNFRLWLSVQAREDLPPPVLHYTVKTIVDTPLNIRRGIIHSWKFVNHEMLAPSSRPEWLALLHNLCFLHCAIRFRTLYGASEGWNCPDVMRFGCAELMESIEVLKNEFKEDLVNEGKLPSWTAVRYLLSETIYGCNVGDKFDMTVLTSMIDYWINANATKKDSDLTKLKCRIPSPFFDPDANLALLMQALESIPQYSLDTPEAFHMHPSPVVPFSEQGYVISKLSQLYGFKQGLWRYGEKSSPTFQKGVKPVTSPRPRSLTLTLPEILPNSADIYTPRLTEIYDLCASILSKLPRGWSRDFINDRIKKLGGDTPFNLFLKKELSHLMSLISEIRNNLLIIKNSLESPDILGDQLSDSNMIPIIHELCKRRPPARWCNMAWNLSCPSDCSVAYFIQDLQQRVTHFEKLLQLGCEKMPIYWLGAFHNPKGLLSVLKQEAIHRYSERTGNVDAIEFKTEITQRDKEHIRDPPHEGIFIHGVHLWGVHWNKTDGEIVDSPPKNSLNILPVIHLQCLPTSEKSGIQDTQKTDPYLCPVYFSLTSIREPVFTLGIYKENIDGSRWALRGMKATIHPF